MLYVFFILDFNNNEGRLGEAGSMCPKNGEFIEIVRVSTRDLLEFKSFMV